VKFGVRVYVFNGTKACVWERAGA